MSESNGRRLGCTRILCLEMVRGAALPLALALTAVLLATLLIGPSWAGNWLGLAMSLRERLSFVLPLLIMASMWVGGRDRRRCLAEVTHSAPRPVWQRVGLHWSALTSGALAGLVTSWLAGAAFVAPNATYSSGSWGASLLVCVPVLGAASAFGLLIGPLVRSTLLVPIVGVLAFVAERGLAAAITTPAVPVVEGVSSWRYLSPASEGMSGEGTQTYTGFADLTQTVWFTAITVTCFVLLIARRKWLSIIPAAIAAGAAALIVSTPPDLMWRDDPMADQLTCTQARETELCIANFRAHLLDDYAELTDSVMAKVADMPGTPARLNLSRDDSLIAIPTLTAALASPESDRPHVAKRIAELPERCPSDSWSYSEKLDSERTWIVASSWLGTSSVPPHSQARTAWHDFRELDASAQRTWIKRYFTAADDCDVSAMSALVRG